MVKSVVLIFLAIEAILAVPHLQYDLSRANEYFDKFIREYGKVYSSIEEKARRFEIFKEWLIRINQQNLENEFATFGINEHSDLSPEELKLRTGHIPPSSLTYESPCASIVPPPLKANEGVTSYNVTSSDFGFDWRDQGAVTKVQDQGFCGSCWAFAVSGNIESQYLIKHGNPLLVSEQQIVDCDLAATACAGGSPTSAYQYLMSVGGIMSAQDYPYSPGERKCAFDPDKIKIKVKGCEYYQTNQEDDVMAVLRKNGPLTIDIAAGDLHGYRGGIITKCSTEPIDHDVLLVGFGAEDSVPYWIIKNSWGHKWGEHGYFRLQMGIGGCGFALNSTRITSAVIE